MHKSIKTTTVKKAKLIVTYWLINLINVANTKDEMNAIRYVNDILVFTKEASLELFKNVAPKYKGEQNIWFYKSYCYFTT